MADFANVQPDEYKLLGCNFSAGRPFSIKGVTMLLVTHRMAMLPLVDRLVVLDQGRVVMDGPRNEVLRKLQGGPGASSVSAAPREAAA